MYIYIDSPNFLTDVDLQGLNGLWVVLVHSPSSTSQKAVCRGKIRRVGRP